MNAIYVTILNIKLLIYATLAHLPKTIAKFTPFDNECRMEGEKSRPSFYLLAGILWYIPKFIS